jgi:hypothetical protein
LAASIQVPDHIGNGLGVGGGGVHLASAVYRIALTAGLAEILSFCHQNEFIHLALTFSTKNIVAISQTTYMNSMQFNFIHVP